MLQPAASPETRISLHPHPIHNGRVGTSTCVCNVVFSFFEILIFNISTS